MKGFFGILAIATTSLVLSACTVAHVSNFKFDASPSPEVSGPGTYIENGGMARISASYTVADEDEVTFPVKSRTLDESLSNRIGGTTMDRVARDSVVRVESNNAILKIDGHHFSASLDFFIKFNTMFVQLGIGGYDGLYYYAAFGANHKYYDWGVFLGEFNQFVTVDYFGYWCGLDGCTEDDKDESFVASDFVILGDVFFGAYVGAHVWRLSLNNTISMYVPGLDVEKMDYDMPYVISNYTSLGFRLSDGWTVRGGTVISFIRNWSKPHLGLKFSIDYSIGGKSKPETKEKWPPAETSTQTPAETQPVKTEEEQPAATETEPAAAETEATPEPAPETETSADAAENDAEEPEEPQAEETAE